MIKYSGNTVNKFAMDSSIMKMYYGGGVAFVGMKEIPKPKKLTVTKTDSSIATLDCDSSSVLTRAEVTAITSIQKAVVGSCVTELGERAFYNNSSITEIDLPSTITNIGTQSISHCANVTSIIVRSQFPPTMKSNYFASMSKYTIYVPSESVDVYKADKYWIDYASKIQAIPNS